MPWRVPSAVAFSGLLLLCGCRRATLADGLDGYREFAYVANSGSNTVTVLDLVYLRPDRTLRVGEHPVALAVNPKRDEVYVVNSQCNSSNGSVSIIDSVRNEVAATISVHRCPVALAVDPTGRHAYVANSGSKSITVLDLLTRKVAASVSVGLEPQDAVVAPDGRTLIVTGGHAANGSGAEGVALYTINSVEGGKDPLSLRSSFAECRGASSPVILPDSSKAYVACAASRQVMSLSLAAPADSWAVRQDASLKVDHLLALLDVGLRPSALTLKPDGGEIFVSNADSDSISEIATQTNEVGSTFSIGNHPRHGVVSADNGALWVSNSGADSLSLYSIDDGKFVSSVRTGTAPDALAFSADDHQTLLLAADTKSGDVAVIRTSGKLGPALFTILPTGPNPSAIVTKATQRPS